ncbi:P27 family phage terminase small subunit [Chromobacterium subtsugae]|uniref:P27 family phage terminase small subunit n=1 Tax=Chromobacterium subtsugae TaxID=251747 RepID=UPI000641488E|nr:P27 family phage terminase small subunit [Chromobacterium subtsugae]
MDDRAPPFTVIHGGGGNLGGGGVGKREIVSPPPPPGANLAPRERKVWDYVCRQLREAGLEHLTAGLAISIIVKTYVRWIDAEIKLAEVEEKNGGTYFIVTPNGHEQPHQVFYVVKNLKLELLKWLPETSLTLPSVAAVKAKLGDKAPQDDLFDELLNHGRSHPSAASG